MTANGRDVATVPLFSAWSPAIAGAVGLSTAYLPGWVAATICFFGVLCALPFRRFRVVAPLAMLLWGAGWLTALIVRLTGAGIIGLIVVK